LKPQTGDVYCCYAEQDGVYAAYQIVGFDNDNVQVVTLDWYGAASLTEDQCDSLQPLIEYNHILHKDTVVFRYARSEFVPRPYILITNRPPVHRIQDEDKRGFAIGWQYPKQAPARIAKRWTDYSEEEKEREFLEDFTPVQIGSCEERRNMWQLGDSILQTIGDWKELRKFPCLIKLTAQRYYPELLPALTRFPYIRTLIWEHHGQNELDYSDTQVRNLTLDAAGLHRLKLSGEIEYLNFIGPLEPQFQCHISEKAAACVHSSGSQPPSTWTNLMLEQTVSDLSGSFPHLGSLTLNKMSEVDMSAIASYYPYLRSLTIRGEGLCTVKNIAALKELRQLEKLYALGVFGFDGADVPAIEQFPKLHTFWMVELPADAAKILKRQAQTAMNIGVDYLIEKPRTAKWLAENLNNPFRDWPGRNHITLANAKKAAAQYKKTKNALEKATAEREEIADILYTLLQTNLGESASQTAIEDFMEQFDKSRDF
jgi:hypothetical protein